MIVAAAAVCATTASAKATVQAPVYLMELRFIVVWSSVWRLLPNFYSTTAGSLIQTHSFAKFKSSNSFIINKTLPD
jgi:hypothetical protein